MLTCGILGGMSDGEGVRQGATPRGGRPRKPRGRPRRGSSPRAHGEPGARGHLRIGDAWNAITIIALSQTNPLKAIAEFVENSIDARAGAITIIRGKERGDPFLRIVDDGEGIPKDAEGRPDFRYVATHIGDSLKRRLKAQGITGIQGEFGIGLLSFWTVGERLVLSSRDVDGRLWQMEMQKNEPGYTITSRKALFDHPGGTEVLIRPLLPGLRQLSGEKIQNYLASELRDRIRKSGVSITILDRASKKRLEVQPRQFGGRLLHELGASSCRRGDIYLELYLNAPSAENHVGLFRLGTRVLQSVTELDALNHEPWNSGRLQGMIDVPFLPLTPGSRTGVIQDEAFADFVDGLSRVGPALADIIARERALEEEQASRNILKSVQKALREAFLTLPPEDYSWMGHRRALRSARTQETDDGEGRAPGEEEETRENATDEPTGAGGAAEDIRPEAPGAGTSSPEAREFFDFPGPLFSAVIAPSSAVVKVTSEKGLRCIPRDKSRRVIDEGVSFHWSIREGGGSLAADTGEIVSFMAPEEPGLTIVEATATQRDTTVSAQAMVTSTEVLMEREASEGAGKGRGLPGYTFLRAPGELWRSRFDPQKNLVVINNGHRDYVFAAQKHSRKLKYICRLFAKELVMANFPGFDSGELLERVVELSLYTEEFLK